jgi:hypothetical protein
MPTPPAQPAGPVVRQRPGTVTVVVVLLWISVAALLLLGVLLLVGAAGITAGATQAEIEKALSEAGFPTSWAPAVGPVMFSLAAVMFIFAVIQALFAVFISKGSNVARILITILLAIRLVSSIIGMFTIPAFIAQAILDVIVNIVILALLWNARANEFFTDRVRVA